MGFVYGYKSAEKKQQSALEMYNQLLNSYRDMAIIPTPDRILGVVEYMAWELQSNGESSLLDQIYCSLGSFLSDKQGVSLAFDAKYFKLRRGFEGRRMWASFDAAVLLALLSQYLEYGYWTLRMKQYVSEYRTLMFQDKNMANVSAAYCLTLFESVDKFMSGTKKGQEIYKTQQYRAPEFGRHYGNRAGNESVSSPAEKTEAEFSQEQAEETKAESGTAVSENETFAQEQKADDDGVREQDNAFDEAVPQGQNGGTDTAENEDESASLGHHGAENPSEESSRETLESVQKMRDEVLQKAKEEADAIKKAAQKEAEEMLANARGQADALINEARAREEQISETRRNARLENAQKENTALLGNIRFLTDELTKVNETMQVLQQLNAGMRSVEDKIVRQNTEKVYERLFELYSLIADTCDHMKKGSADAYDQGSEVMYDNLLTFMDMICEYLADYNIMTIHSAPGTPFNGTRHKPLSGNNFDPRAAKVKESVRCGFAWGDVVMEKEKVLLYQEEEY